ncbi:hypothetical protein QUF75_17055 [Desulfococcaceae bacterium HSG7]|nr:hypothetical protein [Desulfococcaceae bacterium HSG7]
MIIPKHIPDTAKQIATGLTEPLKRLIKEAITHMRGKHRRAYIVSSALLFRSTDNN